MWGSGEYLLWWVKGQPLPPLLTTSSAGTSDTQVGVLGTPGTSILYGNNSVSGGAHSGGRFTLGCWLDDCQRWGVGAGVFFLGDSPSNFQANSSGDPLLARPIYDVTFPGQAAQILAFPNIATGGVDVSTSTSLVGANLFLTHALCCNLECGQGYRLDCLAGFRFLKMRDDLTINETLVSTDTSLLAPPLGTTFNVFDQFKTENRFYGGDFGLRFQYLTNRFTVDLLTKLALGGTERVTTINGATRITQSGSDPQVFSGGLLALDTNIGRYSSTAFSFVPELQLNLAYRVTDQLKVFVGYTFLYWTHVERAGSQVDLRVNPNYLPPVLGGDPKNPAFLGKSGDFWAQGFNVGLVFNY
jgi:hypothetical protein